MLSSIYLVQVIPLPHGGQRQPSTAVIDCRDESLGAAESERTVTDRLDLVVHAFNGSV